jgi:hypothetical protein
MFNPRPDLQFVPLAGGRPCIVVDDALLEPERWVERAVADAAEFNAPVRNAYPGRERVLPDSVADQLGRFFDAHIRQHLGARRTLKVRCRLSMVTLAPEQLLPRQWICHRDRPADGPEQSIAASVAYLFRDERLGGTRFYRPTGSAMATALLLHDASTLDSEAFGAKYGLQPGYLAGSNRYFEQIASVPPRWNRMLFYDGQQFHSGDIPHPERLANDPRCGRLTLNGFFTCKRSAS